MSDQVFKNKVYISESERNGEIYENRKYYREELFENKDQRKNSEIIAESQSLIPGFRFDKDYSLNNEFRYMDKEAIKPAAYRKMLQNYTTLITRDTKWYGKDSKQMKRIKNALNAFQAILDMPVIISADGSVNIDECLDQVSDARYEITSSISTYQNKYPYFSSGKRRMAMIYNVKDIIDRVNMPRSSDLEGRDLSKVKTIRELIFPEEDTIVEMKDWAQRDTSVEKLRRAETNLDMQTIENREEMKKLYASRGGNLPQSAYSVRVQTLVSDLEALGEMTKYDKLRAFLRLYKKPESSYKNYEAWMENTRYEIEGFFAKILEIDLKQFDQKDNKELKDKDIDKLMRLARIGKNMDVLIKDYERITASGRQIIFDTDLIKQIKARGETLAAIYDKLNESIATTTTNSIGKGVKIDAAAIEKERLEANKVKTSEQYEKKYKQALNAVKIERETVIQKRERYELESRTESMRMSRKDDIRNKVMDKLNEQGISDEVKAVYQDLKRWCEMNVYGTKGYRDYSLLREALVGIKEFFASKFGVLYTGEVREETALIKRIMTELNRLGENNEITDALKEMSQFRDRALTDEEKKNEYQKRGWNRAPGEYREINGAGYEVQNTSDGHVLERALSYFATTDMKDQRDLPLFSHEPCVSDIKQGVFGDCWFLTSLGELVEKDTKLIKDMMLDNGDGTVTVRFFDEVEVTKDGKQVKETQPVYVTVDKRVTTMTSFGAFWPSVMEKAYSLFLTKHHNNELELNRDSLFSSKKTKMKFTIPENTIEYGFISNGGWSANGVQHMTGLKGEQYSINVEEKSLKWNDKPDEMAKNLIDKIRSSQFYDADMYKEEDHLDWRPRANANYMEKIFEYKHLVDDKGRQREKDIAALEKEIKELQAQADKLERKAKNDLEIQIYDKNNELKTKKAKLQKHYKKIRGNEAKTRYDWIKENTELITKQMKVTEKPILDKLNELLKTTEAIEKEDLKNNPIKAKEENYIENRERDPEVLRGIRLAVVRTVGDRLAAAAFTKMRMELAKRPDYKDVLTGKKNQVVSRDLTKVIFHEAGQALLNNNADFEALLAEDIDRETEVFITDMKIQGDVDKNAVKEFLKMEVRNCIADLEKNAEKLSIGQKRVFTGQYNRVEEKLYNFLIEQKEKGSYLSASSRGESDSIHTQGITNNHAFTVMDVYERNGLKFVKVRDPHGRHGTEYGNREKVGKEIGIYDDFSETNGIFEVELTHFVQAFDRISYNKLPVVKKN